MTLIHTNINSSICIPTPQKQYFHFSREAAQEWWAVRELTVFKDGRHCLHEPQGGRDLARQMIMPQAALHPSPFLLVTCVLCILVDCTHQKERFSEICFTFADPLPPSHSLPNLTYFQALHPSSVWFKEMFLILKNPPVSTLLSCHTCWLYTA